MAAAQRDLLFGLIALQVGLIDQAQLVAAFQAWTRDQARPLPDHLAGHAGMDAEGRAALDAMVAVHLKKHAGDTERSLASIPAGRSTRERLAALGDPRLNSTVVHLASCTAELGADLTANYPVGSAAGGDGQRFRVLRPHARGGLGAVFVALDTELKREVALKQIREEYADDAFSRQRFIAEAEITGGLEHPGVVPVYGLGAQADGRPYYAMRFIKGDSLKEAVARFAAMAGSRELELRRLLRRFLDVCNAVDYAHSRGVIHRDIKPANIIVGKHGETLVVDWGLAKTVGHADPSAGERTVAPSSSGSSETLPGSPLGTPAYMSPEQALGDLERVGPRSDVYSLGATLYCLLTGKPPFENEDLGVILRAVEEGKFLRPRQVVPSVEAALEAICLKAMATKPEDRYPTPRAMADDLERWMAGEPVSAWSEPLAQRARRWARRNRTAVATLAASVLVALAGTAGVLAVQTHANGELKQANVALSAANERVTKANADLKAANEREKERFDLAMEAIKLFHGEVGDDLVLKADQFKALRDKLLEGAADFYGKLEGLLKEQRDRASRGAMGNAYFELGVLTDKIGNRTAALAVHEKGLAVRVDLASSAAADVRAQGDVARSLHAIGTLLEETGNQPAALARFLEARDVLVGLPLSGPGADRRRALLGTVYLRIGSVHQNTGQAAAAMPAYKQSVEILTRLADDKPDDTDFRSRLAMAHNSIGLLQAQTAEPDEALESYRLAREIQQKLADRDPAVTEFQIQVASTEQNMGFLQARTGKLTEAMESYGRALLIEQKLADLNPAVTNFRSRLALTHNSIGLLQARTAAPVEAMKSYRRALAIEQKLVDDNSAVTNFRIQLASTHNNVGALLVQTARPAEAMEEYRRAFAIEQKLADDNRTVTGFQRKLALTQTRIGNLQSRRGETAEAMESYRRALAIEQKLVDLEPTVTEFRHGLALAHHRIGNLQSRLGKPAGAMASYRRALAIEQKLADDNPTVTEFRKTMAETHHEIGEVQSKTGKPAEAVESLRRAVLIEQKLVDLNPTVTQFRRDLALSFNDLGVLQSRTGQTAEALESFRTALDVRQKLAEDIPSKPVHRNALAGVYTSMADVHRMVGSLALARAGYERAIEIREAVVRENPNGPLFRSALAQSVRRLGLARGAAGDAALAVGLARRAASLLERLRSHTEEQWFELACSHAALAGAATREGSGISSGQGEVEAVKALDLLRRAVAAGYHDADAMAKEVALDPLRERSDFRLLMMDVIMPADPFEQVDGSAHVE
jgi:tetratricopeptide (TPR) repeat protein/tRNA A-37 threonylcarbamoyl transferase component Bud32